MRIIKEEKSERIHKCVYCKSVYAYLPEDIDRVCNATTKCPVCKEHNCVSIFDKRVKER